MEFRNQTYDLSINILLKYLDQVDESVSDLQLLGCASLDLASKFIEDTIVEVSVYSESALNIFN